MQSNIDGDLIIICDFINYHAEGQRKKNIGDAFKRIVDFCKDKEKGNEDRHHHYFVGFSYGIYPNSGFGNYHFNSNKKITGTDIKGITERIEKRGNLENVMIISISPLECACDE